MPTGDAPRGWVEKLRLFDYPARFRFARASRTNVIWADLDAVGVVDMISANGAYSRLIAMICEPRALLASLPCVSARQFDSHGISHILGHERFQCIRLIALRLLDRRDILLDGEVDALSGRRQIFLVTLDASQYGLEISVFLLCHFSTLSFCPCGRLKFHPAISPDSIYCISVYQYIDTMQEKSLQIMKEFYKCLPNKDLQAKIVGIIPSEKIILSKVANFLLTKAKVVYIRTNIA